MGALGWKTVRKVSSGSLLRSIANSLVLRPHPGQRLNLNRASPEPYYLSAKSPLATFRLMDQARPSINKGTLGTFVPNLGRSASQDILDSFVVTFLLLYVCAHVSTVCLDRFVGGDS
jgi:hypothetical protein